MTQALFDLKQTIIHMLSKLGQDSYQNPQNSSVFTAILINPQGLTQDDLIMLTKLPRTLISDTLSSLRSQNLISIHKRPHYRKKLYQSQIPLQFAFRRYLSHNLSNFKDNLHFVEKISTELSQFSPEAQQLHAVLHFVNYLVLFQQQNTFVVQHFEDYLNGHSSPPSLDSSERKQLLIQLSNAFNHIFEVELTNPSTFTSISNAPPPILESSSNLILQQLDTIKKLYLQQFRNLMEKSEKNALFRVIVNLLYIEYQPPTQDRMLRLLEIPRSTLSEMLKKIEDDRLIISTRSSHDHKLHYFPRIPRTLLLSAMFFQMIRQLQEILVKLQEFLNQLSSNLMEAQSLRQFLQYAIIEYDQIINFLFQLELQLDDTFNLHIFNLKPKP